MAIRFVMAALLVALYWGAPQAAHAAYGQCGTNATWSEAQIPASCDAGIAYSECNAAETDAAAAIQLRYPTRTVEKYGCPQIGNPGYRRCYVRIAGLTDNECGKFYGRGQCSARPEEMGWKGSGATGTGSVCHNGCAYEGSVYAGSPTGRLFAANGQLCKNSDLPAPETPDPGDGDGGGSGEIPGDGGGGGDGGGDGSGPGNGGGDGGGGNGDGDGGEGGGDGDGDGDGDGNGEPGGEQPNIPSPEYEGDIPFPWLDGQIPSSSEGQWNSGLGNGSCPATKTVSVGIGGYAASVEFSFRPLCDFAILIRGLVLAISAVVSAYIIAGVRR